MPAEIKVPALGESVTEATVAKWYKKVGDAVKKDEMLLELETDKVTLEVNAPVAGALKEIKAQQGATVGVGALLGFIEEGAAGAKSEAKPAEQKAAPAPAPQPAARPAAAPAGDDRSGPAARKLMEEKGLKPSDISGTGKDGRITKGDVLSAGSPAPAARIESAPRAVATAPAGGEERVKMSKLRQVIARRLKESQNTAATLTTFNEIDMSQLMEIRNEYKDIFEKKHGVRLGFMSFFVKAVCNALKEIPEVNAHIEGDEIVYKHYYDIGVAVGTEQGLVVPVVRNADQLSLSEIEKEINRLAGKAREGTLAMSDLTGGTFTVSNGGVYGSLLATPILNPPQSGILGMHKIEKRPVVVKDQIVIRPMMYVALSYDHRIIDGRESVTFLVRVKEALEDPRRLVLGI